MQVTVLKVNVKDEQSAKGPYRVAELAYKSSDGQPKTTRVMGFNKDLFALVQTFGPGDVVEVKFEQNAKGYWNLVEAVPTGTKNAVAAPTSTKGQWETAEERAQRQVAIARQSSLERSIEYFTLLGKSPLPNEVIDLADEFVGYVTGGKKVEEKKAKKKQVEVTGDVE